MKQPNKNKKKLPNQATRQDSLNVYNRSKEVADYYRKAGYTEHPPIVLSGSKFSNNSVTETNKLLAKQYDDKVGVNTIVDPTLTQRVVGLRKDSYRKDLDKNRYLQRETADNILNGSAPMQLFDKRIAPRKEVSFEKVLEDDKSRSDAVDIPSYETIANKPFNMLSAKEKAQRVSQYGRAGVPNSYNPNKPINNSNKQNSSQDSLNLYNKGEIRKKGLKGLKTYPFDNIDDLKETDPEAYKAFKRTGIMPTKEYVGNRTTNGSDFVYGYDKPKNSNTKQFTAPTKDLVNKQTKTFKSVVMRKPNSTTTDGVDSKHFVDNKGKALASYPTSNNIPQLKTKGLIQSNTSVKENTDIKIPVNTRTPKSYKVEEETPNKFGGHKTSYEVSDINNINTNTMNGKNKRTITPVYSKGGKINNTGKQIIPKADLGTSLATAGATGGLSLGVEAGMAGVGAIVSLIQANKIKKEEAKKQRLINQNNFDGAVIEQDVYNTQFKNENLNDLPVYADGGNMNSTSKPSTTGKLDSTGGDLVPISDNAEVVVGNKHSEKKIDNSYGVTLSENGEPIANVEDEEVVVNNQLVFSDKLKKGNQTFADIALAVNSKIGTLQTKLETAKSDAEKFSITRTIEGLENKNTNLFKEQELVKQNTVGDTQDVVEVNNGVVPKGAEGLDLLKGMLPLATDNIANAILTKNAPKVSKPITRRSPIIDTSVNVNPMLASIQNSINSGNKTITNNTNSSSVVRAAITSNNLRGIEASTNALADKQNKEIQLKNIQNKVLADTANTNADLNEQYQADVYQNQLEKNASYSDNIQNLVENYKYVKTGMNNDAKERSILELDAELDPTGQTARDLEATKVIMARNKQKTFNINTRKKVKPVSILKPTTSINNITAPIYKG